MSSAAAAAPSGPAEPGAMAPGPAAMDEEVGRALLRSRPRREARLPSRRRVDRFVDSTLSLLFPQMGAARAGDLAHLTGGVALVRSDLAGMLCSLLPRARAAAVAAEMSAALPAIRERLEADAGAILEGDPAAESLEEVVAAYPGFLAIAIHRIAHELQGAGVPVLPRLLSEVAHARTGIDIHPGAMVGSRVCIDHGTGIVIGETAMIGDDVKLYQGVTLGALSVAKSAAGSKRHPTIEDRVVIYANATVLGGDTVVGHDSVIGGNVWLTTSVPPHSFVYHTSQIRVRSVADTLDGSEYSI